MPPSPAYTDTFRVTMTYLLGNGDIAQNVLHFNTGAATPLTLAMADSLSDQVRAAWNDNLEDVQSADLTLRNIAVEDLRSTPYIKYDFAQADEGNDTATVLPWQNAVVCSLYTSHPGRSGRGRVYLPGFTEASNDAGGVIIGTTLAAVDLWATDMAAIATADGESVTWGVLSRVDAVCYDITSWNVDNRWDTQRRRANRRLF